MHYDVAVSRHAGDGSDTGSGLGASGTARKTSTGCIESRENGTVDSLNSSGTIVACIWATCVSLNSNQAPATSVYITLKHLFIL